MNNSESSIPVRIAYIGGGSLNWAPNLMADLASDSRLAADVRLFDLDRAAAVRNARMGERFAAVSTGVPARYVVSDSLPEALTGADVVIVSILPGTFAAMAQDLDIPAQYGILQSVGDTVGPGGFVRAMRAIPMMADIGRAIRDHAPGAYVCNLTNPMSVLTATLHAVFPGIRCWGECHEVTKLRKQVAWIANRDAGQGLFTHRDVEVNVLGINHFTFVDRIALQGRDMMPAYREFVTAHAETGWVEAAPDPSDEHARCFDDRSRVKFDLCRRFGIPAAAGDRHLVEFLPASMYLSDPAGWHFGLTSVDYRLRDQAAKRARAEALADGRTAQLAQKSDEALVEQIAALFGGAPHVSNVNLPNRGQLDGIPQGAVVETNALFSGLGITPLLAGRLPPALESIVADHANRQSALVQAVLAGDSGALFALFHTDPLVADLPVATARQMFGDMVAATQAWLPAQLLEGAA